MSATYNWTYKPGVANKYNLNIPASADNVKPAGICYVALFGNDITGNGSRQYPYKTFTAAHNAFNLSIYIIASGVYRESLLQSQIYGDGDVIFDLFLNFAFLSGGGGQAYNINIRNIQNSGNEWQTIRDVILLGNSIADYTFSLNDSSQNSFNCILSNFGTVSAYLTGNLSINNGFNTFVNIQNLIIGASTTLQGALYFSIYDNCNVEFNTQPVFDYCLFHNCSFRMGSSGSFTPISDIPTLQAFVQTVYPAAVCFTHSAFGDPLFNNPTVGDYTLAFNSPAKNMSYFGTFIGAKSIGYGLTASSGSTSPFDSGSTVNLNITTDSITMANTALTGSTESKVIVNLIQREIRNLPTYGFNADRNGQYIDSIIDLSGNTMSPSQALNTPCPYLVQTGAIVYNGQTYQPGDRFTTITGITAFTTTASGVVQEITEAPERHTVLARFSNGDGFVTSGTSLTNGYWYYVDSGSVTYDATVYSATTIFKAVDTNSFSGSGIVELAMSTEQYQHYEINGKPYSNNSGDTRTGVILRGNGDPAYVRGGINVTEFPINSKFIQIKYVFQVANLTP